MLFQYFQKVYASLPSWYPGFGFHDPNEETSSSSETILPQVEENRPIASLKEADGWFPGVGFFKRNEGKIEQIRVTAPYQSQMIAGMEKANRRMAQFFGVGGWFPGVGFFERKKGKIEQITTTVPYQRLFLLGSGVVLFNFFYNDPTRALLIIPFAIGKVVQLAQRENMTTQESS